jgi:hypothetical protein
MTRSLIRALRALALITPAAGMTSCSPYGGLSIGTSINLGGVWISPHIGIGGSL